jgi:4-hydroxybenzoate polyprenyltransferase
VPKTIEKFKNLVLSFRVREVIPKLAFVLVGCMIPMIEEGTVFRLSVFLLALSSFFFAAAIYGLNSFWGYESDQINPRLQPTLKLSRSQYLHFALGFMACGYVLLFFLPFNTLLIAHLVLALWIAYSIPKGLKGIPWGGLSLAFITQVAHYFLGYSVYQIEITITAGILSVYFGLMVASGHMLHEFIDYEADKLNGEKTTACKIGPINALRLSFMLQFAALLALFLLSFWSQPSIYLLFVIPSIVHLLIHPAFNLFMRGHIFTYRKLYLVNYALVCVLILILGLVFNSGKADV